MKAGRRREGGPAQVGLEGADEVPGGERRTVARLLFRLPLVPKLFARLVAFGLWKVHVRN